MKTAFKGIQNFIIGLLTGTIAGGIIVWFEMKDANRNFLSQILFELNTLKLEKKIAEDEQEKKVLEGKIRKSPDYKLIKALERKSKGTKSDSLQALAEPDQLQLQVSTEIDTSVTESAALLTDSFVADSARLPVESMIVKKDRLVYSVFMKLIVRDEEPNRSISDDSLIAEISGIQKEDGMHGYSVEFWESPINYKGYKMGNKKIIVFGIEGDFDNCSLFQIDKKIYLKHTDRVYLIEETYNFEPLKKVTDKSLLAKIG